MALCLHHFWKATVKSQHLFLVGKDLVVEGATNQGGLGLG